MYYSRTWLLALQAVLPCAQWQLGGKCRGYLRFGVNFSGWKGGGGGKLVVERHATRGGAPAVEFDGRILTKDENLRMLSMTYFRGLELQTLTGGKPTM